MPRRRIPFILGVLLVVLGAGAVPLDLDLRSDGQWFEPGWAWLYEARRTVWSTILATLAAGVALVLLSRYRQARGLLVGALLVAAVAAVAPVSALLGEPGDLARRVVLLPDAGPHHRAALLAAGRQELDLGLWVRETPEDRFVLAAEGRYPPCAWPIEVLPSPRGPRALVLDRDGTAVALVRVHAGDILEPGRAPGTTLGELRAEFGARVRAVLPPSVPCEDVETDRE